MFFGTQYQRQRHCQIPVGSNGLGAMKKLYTKRDAGLYMTVEEQRIIEAHRQRTADLQWIEDAKKERLERERQQKS